MDGQSQRVGERSEGGRQIDGGMDSHRKSENEKKRVGQTDGQSQRVKQREKDSRTDRWIITEAQTMRKREQDRQMDNHRG